MNLKNVARSVFLLAGIMLGAGSLSAASITLHNTGVNSADVVQPLGSATSFWTLVSEPAGASEALGSTPFRYHNGSYYADNALAGWVAPTANGTAGAGGNYVYELVFNLTGFNPATAEISGTFGTDNDGALSLNGGAPVATTCFGCFGSPTAFTINSGFVAGLNTIFVRVDNGGDPTAFNVEFSSGTAMPSGVPEPSALALMAAGLVALSLYRRFENAAH